MGTWLYLEAVLGLTSVQVEQVQPSGTARSVSRSFTFCGCKGGVGIEE